jgi:hypothetical protein
MVESIFPNDHEEHPEVIWQQRLFTIRVHMAHDSAIYHSYSQRYHQKTLDQWHQAVRDSNKSSIKINRGIPV